MLLTFGHHRILRALGSILDAGILGTEAVISKVLESWVRLLASCNLGHLRRMQSLAYPKAGYQRGKFHPKKQRQES